MFQQIFAFIIILFFLVRLFWQKKKENIDSREFVFWLFFWLGSGLVVVFIKKMDNLVAELGFSSAGIDVLFYLSILLLFSLVFRLRIRQEKIDREITKIIREIAISNKQNER